MSLKQSLSNSHTFLLLFQMLVGDIESALATAYNYLTNAGKHGFGGHSGGGTGGRAKQLIVIVILVLIIPFIALLFSGATTGSGGLYGNASIGYAVRQSTFSFSQFIVLVMVLGALGIVLALL